MCPSHSIHVLLPDVHEMGELDLSRAVSLAEHALSDGDFTAADRLAKEALQQGTSYEALVYALRYSGGVV